MYPKINLVVILCTLMVFLSGCQPSTPPNNQQEPPQNQSQENPQNQSQEKQVIHASTVDPLTQDSWTQLSQSSVDLDADNEEESLILYTAAQRDSKGEIMWDDGQKWLLLVKDDTSYYTLFSEYVQLGSVYFTVAGIENTPTPRIGMLVSTGSNLSLTNYTYVQGKQGYEEETAYDSGIINSIFTSFPAYQ